MFKSATLRLTAFYIILLAAISLFFSVNWYNGATTQVQRGLERQRGALIRNFENRPFDGVLQEIRAQQIEEAQKAIITNIVTANIVLLTVGGYASYLLAKKTIRPIEEAHDAQARFIADASHELRTPISVMRSEIEVELRKKSISKQARRLLESTLEEVTELQQLSDNLLQIASISTNAKTIELASFPLKPVIEKAVFSAKKIAESRDITIRTTIDAAQVVSHKDSIRQIVTILLDNAIKYSPDSSTVELIGEISDERYVISLTDKAGGISNKDQQHIFERFYRVNKKRTQGVSGNGLGLSIARELANHAGAEVTLAKSDDKGSTFHILIKNLG